MLLKKEVNKTHTEGDQDESGNYRQVKFRFSVLIICKISNFCMIYSLKKLDYPVFPFSHFTSY